MRLAWKNLDYNQDLIPQIFCNSMGESLTKAQLVDVGYDDNIEFQRVLNDVKNNPIAYLFKRNGLFGAYDKDGHLCMPFIYNKFSSIITIKSEKMFIFRRSNGMVDLYIGTNLLYADVVEYGFVYDYALDGERRFLTISDRHMQIIYDMLDNEEITTCLASYDVLSINSKFELIICQEKKGNDVESFIMDYYGQIVSDLRINEVIVFTDYKDFYITYQNDDYDYGIVHLESGKWETVADNWYSSLMNVFPNRAVVFNDNINIQIIKYYKKGNDWIIETEFAHYSGDIKEIQIFENEKDGIICFKNGGKILISNYDKINREQFICDEIIYEGNGIFQCFVFDENKQDYNVTYICCGQAVNYASNNKQNIFMAFRPDLKRYSFVNSYGKTLFSDTDVDSVMDLRRSFATMDFMTIQPEMKEQLLQFSLGRTDYVINGVTGDVYKYNTGTHMVWHNLFEVDGKLHLIEKTQNHDEYNVHDVIATFNNHIIIQGESEIYICDNNFQFITANSSYVLDVIYQKLITSSTLGGMMLAVSNDGIEYFDYNQTIQGKRVYKSRTTENYVIGSQYVYLDRLKEDLWKGLVDDDFKVLI